jgi:inosose dehydratase
MSSIDPGAAPARRRIARLALGTCPDSWGVWFADDPLQTPWERFLDEVADVGYEWVELGPYGYLPTDPVQLTEEVSRRGLKVAGGTMHGHSGLHRAGESQEYGVRLPDIESVTNALLELEADFFVVVEQDMYPVDFDLPKPIAQRTYNYLRSVGIGQPDGTGGER